MADTFRIKDGLIGILVIALISLISAVGLITDWIWFGSVGYGQVFSTIFIYSIITGAIFGLAFLAFSTANAYIAFSRSGKKKDGKYPIIAVLFILSLFLGTAFGRWETVLAYINATPFGVADPIFGLDVSFYVFTLPFYQLIYAFLFAGVAITAAVTFIIYLFRSKSVRKVNIISEGPFAVEQTSIDIKWDKLPSFAKLHMYSLGALLLALIGIGFYLAQFSMLFSGGTVYGAGYVEAVVGIPLMNILAVISFISAVILLTNIKLKKSKVVFTSIGLIFAVGILGSIAMGLTQALVVSPDEFRLEAPYIENNIMLTSKAYGIDKFEVSDFPLSYNLTIDDIENNREIIDNIRLWDWRPLSQTYEQLQLFRTYYNFYDVDVDRYNLGGQDRQVMVSARSLDFSSLPSNARTWVNRHLVYTHGYGVVMNPVNNVTGDGLPEFIIQDIPPKSDYFNITRPQIYYGEGLNEYAIVKTDTEELDYPSGNENIYTTYEGKGGVPLGDGANRLLFALRLASVDMLVSGSLNPESRLMIYREVRERAGKIAPFLAFDRDPYNVIDNGKLFWILDAYTVTSKYPYSEPVSRGSINYIRNSVKVVIDAYNGNIDYYIFDPKDPIIRTYEKIFPGLFKEISEMPKGLMKHLRYPEDMFNVQAQIYSVYHMKDPRVFYNKEDVWITPNEIYRGRESVIEPYYIITTLPGNDKEEFMLIKPFVPRGKQNLISWMAARSDPPNYGKVKIFQFSKQELAYGPMQIEARIDQNTEISQSITLWSQAGSSVVRGNTLVIPIENSLLYIEPLFLEATAQGTLPELKRVIVAYDNKISMKPTLKEALKDVFGVAHEQDGGEEPSSLPPGTAEETLQKVSELYDNAQKALRNGDLKEYADYIERIGELLNNALIMFPIRDNAAIINSDLGDSKLSM